MLITIAYIFIPDTSRTLQRLDSHFSQIRHDGMKLDLELGNGRDAMKSIRELFIAMTFHSSTSHSRKEKIAYHSIA